jgi:hypothetical protein
MELILIKLKPCSLSRGIAFRIVQELSNLALIAFRIMQELSNLALREARQVYNILWSLSETPNCMFLAIRCNLVKLHITSANRNR